MPDVSNSQKITARIGLANPLYTRKGGWDMSIPAERGPPLPISLRIIPKKSSYLSIAKDKYIIALKSCQPQISRLRFKHHLACLTIGKFAKRRLCFNKREMIGNHPSDG